MPKGARLKVRLDKHLYESALREEFYVAACPIDCMMSIPLVEGAYQKVLEISVVGSRQEQNPVWAEVTVHVFEEA